jgi:hypothetical protein
VGVGDGECDGVGDGDGECDGVGDGDGECDGVGDGDGECDGVGDGECVGVALPLGVGEGPECEVPFGTFGTAEPPPPPQPAHHIELTNAKIAPMRSAF